jgi:hypothetical protein
VEGGRRKRERTPVTEVNAYELEDWGYILARSVIPLFTTSSKSVMQLVKTFFLQYFAG